MSSNKNEKSIRNLIRLTKKELKDLRINDLLDDPKLKELYRRAKPKSWGELTEDERSKQAKEQAEAEREFIREQKILRIKQLFQSIMKAKCNEPNSKLFTTAEELLEFVVKYESSPSSVSNYEWNKFETILLTRLESLLQANEKEGESTVTEQGTRNSGDTYNIIGKHVSFGDRAQHAERDITTSEIEEEKGSWGYVKKFSIILGIIVALIAIYKYASDKTENKPPIEQTMNDSSSGTHVADNNIDVTKVNNNYTFNFNAPVEISFHKSEETQEVSQSGSLESLAIDRHRENFFEYLPNGLKIDNNIIEITSTSRELKRFFNFTKSNFTKTITGKQLKEMNSLLNQILSKEPDFAYARFYRGLLFSFVSVNPEFKYKFSSIAESSFKRADGLFDVLLEEHPNDPFLLLYKGMNLTFLDRGEESVSCLKRALHLESDIFQRKQALGIIACWNHIDPKYLKEWQTAMEEY